MDLEGLVDRSVCICSNSLKCTDESQWRKKRSPAGQEDLEDLADQAGRRLLRLSLLRRLEFLALQCLLSFQVFLGVQEVLGDLVVPESHFLHK